MVWTGSVAVHAGFDFLGSFPFPFALPKMNKRMAHHRSKEMAASSGCVARSRCLRVLFLAIWYPNQEDSTQGTFIRDQAEALRTAGSDVRVVQPVPFAPFPITLFKDRYRNLAAIPKQTRDEDFHVHHPRYVTFPQHRFYERVGDLMYRSIWKTVARIYEEWPFDIIHAHTTYPCGYVANLMRERLFPNIKVVHTVHRYCVVDVPRYNAQCLQRVGESLRGADRIVFVSKEGQRLGVEYAGSGIVEKSEYITNGVNPAKFDLSDRDHAEVKRLKADNSGTWNLVFIGGVSERKGVNELLDAVRKLVEGGCHGLHLFLIGRNECGTFVADFLREHHLCEVASQVGPVPHDRIKIWMNFADAVILPSHSEGIPTVLFESLYTGAPAIFTGVGGIPDIVDDQMECLIIPPHSAEAIEKAVVHLMSQPELGREMGARGHELVRSNFTWAHNAARHLRLYETLVPERSEWDVRGNR